MMPSRGITPLAGAARLLRHPNRINSRALSTATRNPHPRYYLHRQQLPRQNAQLRAFSLWPSSGSTPPSPSAATTSSLPPPASSPPPTEPLAAATASLPHNAPPVDQSSVTYAAPPTEMVADPSVITQEIADFSQFANPEQIGYLHSIGLDYGYGPTSMLEWALEHVHVYTGLPWWSSIIITAVSLRLVFFPLFLRSSDMGARQAALQPVLKPMNKRMLDAYHSRDTEEIQRIQAEMKSMYSRAEISMTQMFAPLMIQGVFAYGALKLMRGMANLPVPGLQDGGFLWVTDLTVADPTFALPIIMAGTLHLLIRFGGETGTLQQTNPGMRSFLLYVMPGIIVISMSWFPAAVNLWLSSTGLTGIIQAKVLQSPSVRSRLGLTPIIKPQMPGEPETTRPAKTTIDVKGTSRSASEPTTLRYQAPNLKYSQSSKVHMSTANERPKSIVDTVIKGPQTFVTDQVNSLGEGWATAKDTANAFSDRVRDEVAKFQGTQSKSKTRSNDFLRRAKEYEANARDRKRR